MRDPDYVNRAKLNPARTFKSPMDVVETNDIEPAEKLAILNAWESDERALLQRRRRRDGWRRACASSQGASGPRPSQVRSLARVLTSDPLSTTRAQYLA
jgi:hypothetical protein